MGEPIGHKIYTIPKGYVTADPGRNRYIRRHGTSMELPPRLHPGYSSDVADPRNGVDLVGVATDLRKIGVSSGAIAGAVPAAVAGALMAGLETVDELRSYDARQKK